MKECPLISFITLTVTFHVAVSIRLILLDILSGCSEFEEGRDNLARFGASHHWDDLEGRAGPVPVEYPGLEATEGGALHQLETASEVRLFQLSI